MEPVRTHRAKTVVEAARLHRAKERRERGQTLLEGPGLILDALKAGCRARRLFGLAGDRLTSEIGATHHLDVISVDERALQRVAGTKTPRGPVAVVDIPRESLDAGSDVLVSWGVSDPGNVGTLIRTAASFDWDYAYARGSADPWSPKALRAGAGGQFQTGICSIDDLEDVEPRRTLATVVSGGVAPTSVSPGPVAVLIGEESVGLPEDVTATCSQQVTIATPGPTESLNAAIAAAIVIYELSKRTGQLESGV